jgi:hypothetical protein
MTGSLVAVAFARQAQSAVSPKVKVKVTRFDLLPLAKSAATPAVTPIGRHRR